MQHGYRILKDIINYKYLIMIINDDATQKRLPLDVQRIEEL